MGTIDILKELKKGEKLTSMEIAENTKCSATSVKQSIRRLMKDFTENLTFRVLTSSEKEEKYGHKISCKVHIYWLDE